jgi:hypothetical protein
VVDPVARHRSVVSAEARGAGVARVVRGVWNMEQPQHVREHEYRNQKAVGTLRDDVLGTPLRSLACTCCRWSGTALALAEDHRNDVLANVAAMAAAASAAHHSRVWWLDPAGALAIATYIIISWLVILRQQVLSRSCPTRCLLTL